MGWFKIKARTNLGPQNYMYLTAPGKLPKANLFLPIANMNHCLSLGLTKTDYETTRVIPHNPSVWEIWNERWHCLLIFHARRRRRRRVWVIRKRWPLSSTPDFSKEERPDFKRPDFSKEETKDPSRNEGCEKFGFEPGPHIQWPNALTTRLRDRSYRVDGKSLVFMHCVY